MGQLEDRIRRLESRCGATAQTRTREQVVTDGRLLRLMDEHIDRMIAAIEREERGEGVPAQEWEAIDEEGRRLDSLCAESRARSERNQERWQEYIRRHRPDLLERGPTILDREIAEARARIAEIEAEKAIESAEADGE